MNDSKRKILVYELWNDDSSDSSSMSGMDSEEDVSCDEEVCMMYSNISDKNKRNCIRNYFEEIVCKYTDSEFKMHFRISRALFVKVLEKYKESDNYKKIADYYNVKSADKQIAVFLWFAGHEACSYRDLADRFDLSLWTVHHIIYRVTIFISGLSEKFISWPSDMQQDGTADHFLRKTRFPGIIGCLDGTHIEIDKPKASPDDYIDRKGVRSIILQGICNENKKFIDIFVGWPGSAHDSRVFKNSVVHAKLGDIRDGYYLLGDSAYPCLTHLIVPYKDNGHLTRSQKKFNRILSSCRVYIEHAFGILKQRFRQLYHCKLQSLKILCHFVRACCVLHNLSNIDEDSELFDYEAIIVENTENTEYVRGEENGKTLRDEICQHIFVI